MNVLVATKETQGQRENDFCYVPEGELVYFGSECDREDVDGVCGCRRSMCGMETRKGTTTMKVVRIPFTKEEYVLKLRDALIRAGWMQEPDKQGNIYTISGPDVQKMVKELMKVADFFPTGTILERRGNKMQKRITRR